MRLTAILCLFIYYTASGQAIENNWSYENISRNLFLRVNYENDVFSGTDKYYTQGICIETAMPRLKSFPLSKLLLKLPCSGQTYGLGIEQDVYTPNNLGTPAIQYGDYPFSACLFLKTFCLSIDSAHKQRFTTTLSTGVIGPAGGGMQMQTTIHRALNDVIPRGWPNQISNDAILNYEANYEKLLASIRNILNMSATAMGRTGTLSDELGGGLTLMLGYFNSPFCTGNTTKHSWQIYFYEHADVNFVGYDATLEGGLFDRNSPYTIAASSMNKVILQNRFGIMFNYHRVYFEYFQSYLSRQFVTEDYHVWGGVQFAMAL